MQKIIVDINPSIYYTATPFIGGVKVIEHATNPKTGSIISKSSLIAQLVANRILFKKIDSSIGGRLDKLQKFKIVNKHTVSFMEKIKQKINKKGTTMNTKTKLEMVKQRARIAVKFIRRKNKLKNKKGTTMNTNKKTKTTNQAMTSIIIKNTKNKLKNTCAFACDKWSESVLKLNLVHKEISKSITTVKTYEYKSKINNVINKIKGFVNRSYNVIKSMVMTFTMLIKGVSAISIVLTKVVTFVATNLHNKNNRLKQFIALLIITSTVTMLIWLFPVLTIGVITITLVLSKLINKYMA